MKLNTRLKYTSPVTHEGAVASRISFEQQLRRSVAACMLWEDTFYEDGETVAHRIVSLIAKVSAPRVAEIALDARVRCKLRHVPLLVAREMARLDTHKHLVAETLEQIIQRPDELTEFLAIYMKDKKQPLSAQVKKGLARAFQKFDEYSLAKYNREDTFKLRDVLFLCHAKPQDATGRAKNQPEISRKDYKRGEVRRHTNTLYRKLIDGKLETPDTWEVELSASTDKKASWTRLLKEGKLFALALLRNLRNMKEAGVPDTLVKEALGKMKTERVLPFRFISAARYAPHLEPELENAMFRCTASIPKLPGKTAIVVDNSGSMYGVKISAKSELDRADAACALAILVREVCEDCIVIGFGSEAKVIPARRGFALADAIKKGPGGGTNTQTALLLAAKEGYDRVIVITDEQSHQTVRNPLIGTKGYFLNIACYQNGVGYGAWSRIDGWSESVLDYIAAVEDLDHKNSQEDTDEVSVKTKKRTRK